ncbi:hypothetical protein [Salinarimonas chemoclinalis]|uniref:hypothetical protein n=1 Tax=Salinarimonas chemoclinalis TaxID=3241599 RepID=UPI003556EA4A
MSRYVVLGLFAEGPSDFGFLLGLLAREAFAVIAREGTQAVIIGEPVVSLDGRSVEDRTRVACALADNVDVFIVHGDSSRTARAAVERLVVADLRHRAQATCGLAGARFVGLLPSREMEAWALADPDALAQACGYVAWPASIELFREPTEAERLADPKQALDTAIGTLVGTRRRGRSISAAAYLDRIGETASLERLRRLDSYARFASDLRAALDHLGLLRRT